MIRKNQKTILLTMVFFLFVLSTIACATLRTSSTPAPTREPTIINTDYRLETPAPFLFGG